MWRTCVLLFIYISTFNAYDLEVKFKMDNELIDKIKQIIHNKDHPASIQLDLNVPADIIAKLSTDDTQPLRQNNIMLRSDAGSLPDHNEKTFSSVYKELVEELSHRGVARLKSINIDLENQLKPTIYAQVKTNIASRIEAATTRLIKKIRNYSEKSAQINSKRPIDRELILQDTVDAANEIIFNETRRFLEKYKKISPQVAEDIQNSMQEAYKRNLVYRKEDYNYLCMKFSFCRAYPGYFDFFGGLLREVIELSDSKLHTFLMKSTKIIQNRILFFENVIGKKTVVQLAAKLQELIFGDLSEFRKTISFAREIINQRRRWIFDNDLMLNDQKRALRVIMDIIDESFNKDGEQAVMFHFDNTVRALREWARDARNDIETVIFSFITFTIDTLENKWGSSTVEEIYTMVQRVWSGKSNGVNDYLLNVGSNYTSKLMPLK